MAGSRIRSFVTLSLAFATLVVAAAPSLALVTPEPVITGRGDQWLPSANDDWVAYSFWLRSSPNRQSALAWNIESETTVRLNEAGTNGGTGAFDPGTNTVLYQQWDGNRSDLYLRDLDGDTRTKVRAVNSPYWEWYPLISSTFITFLRDRYAHGRWETSMYVYRRDSGALRRLWTYPAVPVGTYNGSVGDRYVAYTICRDSCSAYLYDWVTRETRRIPGEGKEQYAPVIDEVNGTVYVTRMGARGCGVRIKILRHTLAFDAPAEVIVELPDGIDTGWTGSIAPNGDTGMMDLWLERWDCERRAADVYVARSVDAGPI